MARKFARVNSRRFYCDFENSPHSDTADVKLNMLKHHYDIGAIFFTEKIAPKIAVNTTRETGL